MDTTLPGVCSISWCIKPMRGKTFCGAHLQRHYRGQDMDLPWKRSPNKPTRGECSVYGCKKLADCALPEAVCAAHRILYYNRGTYHKQRMSQISKICCIEGCDSPARTRMSCVAHATRCSMYSLTIMQMHMLFVKGCCDLCGIETRKLSIDHDHACCPGAKSCGDCVRGALCTGCNVGLGAFRDSVDKLALAVKYLNGSA